MHAGGHDGLAGLQPARHQQHVVAWRAHRHRHGLHRLRCGVVQPDHIFALILEQRAHRHPHAHAAAIATAAGPHKGGRCGHAKFEFRRWIRYRNLDGVRACDRVGCRRNLAHLGRNAARLIGPQLHAHLRRFAQRIHLILGNADHDFLLCRLRHAHHRLACGHHLSDFGVDPGHYAIGVGFKRGITGLIHLVAIAGPGLLVAGLRGVIVGLMALLLRRADKALGEQFGVALEISRGQIAIGLGRRQLRLGRLLGKSQICRVQPRKHLAFLDGGANVHEPGDDLARYAEAQARFDARAYVAGEFRGAGALLAGHCHGPHRAHLGRLGCLLAAAGQ